MKFLSFIAFLCMSVFAFSNSEWFYYKHYPWVYDNVTKDWLYLRGADDGKIYAYKQSTKTWSEFSVPSIDQTLEQKYSEWIKNPEPYGGLSVLQLIKQAKINSITELNLYNKNILNISPLEDLTHLKKLSIDSNNITDISHLSKLTNLEFLELDQNKITNISVLSNLTNLKELWLSQNNLSDIKTLSSLKKLEGLSLIDCNVSDLTPLAVLSNLKSLHLNNNPITTSQKAMLEVALPNTTIYWPSVIVDDRSWTVSSASNMEMLWVEPGTFTMGSPTTEVGRSSNETQHNVRLTKGFYLGKYEVTQAQYEAVMTGNTVGLSATPSHWPNNPNHPVEKISWDDIQVFLARLNDSESTKIPTGWTYVLPTEAQWEYACRAGTNTTYSWGTSISSVNANYNPNIGQTQEVGQYSPNQWGFFDMHGNVWEWVADWYGPYDSIAATDPLGPASGSNRVNRGGSWDDTKDGLRLADRVSDSPSARYSSSGFRLAYMFTGKHSVDLNTSVQLDMLWVEPGTFTMGSPTTEVGRESSETVHNVILTKGFYLGKYEVTQAQYEAVMTGNNVGLSATPSHWPNNPNHPVGGVSWEDVQIFLTHLNAHQSAIIPAGWAYVLPTEAQWEYACRAGTTTVYSWGNEINPNLANYYEQDKNETTVNVGSYLPNPWGFYDMHGNVWEWVADWYGPYDSNAVTNPTGPTTGSRRVKRGGSLGNDGSYLRSAKRYHGTPSYRGGYRGFRVGLASNP